MTTNVSIELIREELKTSVTDVLPKDSSLINDYPLYPIFATYKKRKGHVITKDNTDSKKNTIEGSSLSSGFTAEISDSSVSKEDANQHDKILTTKSSKKLDNKQDLFVTNNQEIGYEGDLNLKGRSTQQERKQPEKTIVDKNDKTNQNKSRDDKMDSKKKKKKKKKKKSTLR
eukprot:NODE_8638_length_660_cov_21.752328_g8013_i0.p1 GENE.NODE_8638_length_660_cov_21.752328_g8013_i0~~NODE_8638_length_660_cov_21.752328_g8013_i0.p1  ORF type:complete len:172 (-),score=16.88 NODE_8638_length_660_cov_21.752328_g8013_i0:3-518(-)